MPWNLDVFELGIMMVMFAFLAFSLLWAREKAPRPKQRKGDVHK